MRDEFQITRQGKTHVLFAGLLDEAHSRGLVGIDTELIQLPEDSNGQVAIVKATVQIEESAGSTGSTASTGSNDSNGAGQIKTYSGIGDASPQNVSRNIVPHLIRMAETRAKARALRDAVNVSATVLEEVAESDTGDDGLAANQGQSTTRRNSAGQSDQSAGDPANVRDLPRQNAGQRASNDQDEGRGSQGSQGREGSKAPKSQIDFIKTLAEEWRGEKGVERLEQRIGKPLSELNRSEAESWIDKLTPKDGQHESEKASGES